VFPSVMHSEHRSPPGTTGQIRAIWKHGLVGCVAVKPARVRIAASRITQGVGKDGFIIEALFKTGRKRAVKPRLIAVGDEHLPNSGSAASGSARELTRHHPVAAEPMLQNLLGIDHCFREERQVAEYARQLCARRTDFNRRGRGYCVTAGAREHRSWSYDSCGFS
jgi:hypothetical protein